MRKNHRRTWRASRRVPVALALAWDAIGVGLATGDMTLVEYLRTRSQCT